MEDAWEEIPHILTDFKLDTVWKESEEKEIAQICRERKIKDTQYYKWRETFLENAANIFDDQQNNTRN